MRRRLPMLLTAAVLLGGCALAATCSAAAAATLSVNTTRDGLAPGPGLCSLREAVQAVDAPGTENGNCAAADFGANTIVLGPGTYRLTQPDASGTQLTISSTVTSLAITGAGEGATVISGAAAAPADANNGGGGDRILAIAPGPAVTISDLTITSGQGAIGDTGTPGYGATAPGAGNAQPAGTGQPGGDGGAILNAGGLTLLDAAITDSHAGAGGLGGNSNWPGAWYPGVAGGEGGRGGDGGAIFNTGTLTLTGVTLADDGAGAGGAGGSGGFGLPAGGDGGSGGGGGSGGAVANSGGTVLISTSTIKGGTAGAGGAGGIGGGGSPYAGSTPAAGRGGAGGAGGDGAGVWSDGGTLRITNSTFVSDTAGSGGAGGTGGQQGQPGGAGGTGGNGGGGAVSVAGNGNGNGSATIMDATVVANAAGGPGAGGAGSSGGPAGAMGAPGTAGGIAGGSSSPLDAQNTLVALNAGGNCGGEIVDRGHDLSFRDASCPASFAGGDPRLGSLADHGGPAETISLKPGSAALDQVPAVGSGCPPADERGVARPAGAACDIGAFELAPPLIGAPRARPLAAGRETVCAPVTPDAAVASVFVEYGTARRYRSRSRELTIRGVTAAHVSILLRGLTPGRTYRYRVVAISPDGSTTGAARTFTAPVPAVVSALALAPTAFAPGGAGTSIAYRDTQPAVTSFTVLRRTRRGWAIVGTFTHRDRRGDNRVHFGGRLHGRRLAPGRYRLRVTPRSHGLDGRGASVGFIVRRYGAPA